MSETRELKPIKGRWISRGYKVRKGTLSGICSRWLEKFGSISPEQLCEIQRAMQDAIYDQEVLSTESQQLRKTSVLRGESVEPHDIGEADTTVSPPQAEAEKEKKKNV